MQVLGVSHWSARLVPACHAGLMLVGLYLAARHIAGEATARRAVWVLGSSLAFLYGGQFINHDMLVATWIGVAIWCFAAAILSEGPRRTWLALGGFAACALGVLSKGLIGVVLPGLVLFIWLFVARLWHRVPRLPWVSGLLLFCAMALPWFVLAQQKYPGLFDYLIIGQHFRRYTGDNFNNQWPAWGYLVVLLVLLFPWALLVPFEGVTAVVRKRLGVLRSVSPWPALLWIWLIAITVFFSIPKSKLVGYILPVMPPLALLAAMAWQARWGASARASKVFAVLCVINLGIGGLTHPLAVENSRTRVSQDVAQVLVCRMDGQDTVLVAGGYPYDLPFEANLSRPLIVVHDWPLARQTAGDDWRRELFEGADFDPQAGQVLQNPEVLTQSPPVGRWLVTPRDTGGMDLGAWRKVFEGSAWTLWESTAFAGAGATAVGGKDPSCNKLLAR